MRQAEGRGLPANDDDDPDYRLQTALATLQSALASLRQGRPDLGEVVFGAHGFAGAKGLREAAVGAAPGGSGVGAARRGQYHHQPETRPAFDLGGNPLDFLGRTVHLDFGCGTTNGPSASASMDDLRKVSSAWSGLVTMGSPMLNDVFNTIGRPVFFSNSAISSA